ncbi:MAG TPA: PQQ-binding-like beta-propeller repeat protein, partial [Candidatus Solibacter sp.]
SELRPTASVTVVEAGKRIFDLENRMQYRRRNLDYAENPWPGDFIEDQAAHGIISRTMAAGGSALHWGGTCNRFSEEDVRLQSMFGLGVDWPLEWNELEKFYCEAERRLGVSGEPSPLPEDRRSQPYPMPPMAMTHNLKELKAWAEKSGIPFWSTPQAKNTEPYDGRAQCIRCNTCSICPTGARYSPDFTFKKLLARKNFELHDRTLVRRLGREPGNGAIVVAQSAEVEYRARLFVLASGYCWTPHLLLLSGLANRSGLVGRYMCGHAFHSAFIEIDASIFPGMNEQHGLISRQFFRSRPGQPFLRHDLRIWESASGHEPRLRAPDGSYLFGDRLLADWRERARRGTARVRGYVDVHPDRESSLTLNINSRNQFGDPMPLIAHQLDPASEARRPAVREHFQNLFATLAKANNGKILNTSAGNYLDHPAGGCRMGTDPDTSVCDSYGQTHDHENLFVVGAPTLPNAGCTNGTLTFVALTLRSAERIAAHLALVLLCVIALRAQEWTSYGGDPGEQHYSALAQINRGNAAKLKPLWEWKTGEEPLPEFKTTPGAFEVTPLKIGKTLYLSTPYNRVIALDEETGRELWSYDPKAYVDGQVPNGTGFVHRGVGAWRDSKTGKLRIIMNSRYRLIQLDAETGKPVTEFGDNGVVNLLAGLRWETNPKNYTNTSPVVIYKDLIIVGNGVADKLAYKQDPPGDVRAFHARTGKLAWTFYTVPRAGEFGVDSWGNGSEKFTGHTNVWAPMTLDDARGLLYLPVSTPSNDFYGGARPGQNLFGEALVCLDANTGKRKWHFQTVHHGLWDYDLPGPPVLATIRPEGKKIDVVVQLTKTGWAFVFDRVTGKPVWPIEERPVPPSDVPGEKAWPTQPFPTRPPAFSEQGVSLDDAFDLTPELKAEAQAELKKYRLGPLFTPPSLQGTVMRPGLNGGANWGGGALDPETGILYVKTTNTPGLARVAKVTAKTDDVDADYTLANGTLVFHGGIPLFKPPYGSLTAIDLNRGEILWRVPFGDDARIRANPALKGVKLPDHLGAPGTAGGVVTKGGIIFIGGGDFAFHVVNTTDGQDLWTYDLGRRTMGTPMTYRTTSGKQIVVIANGLGRESRLSAFALE